MFFPIGSPLFVCLAYAGGDEEIRTLDPLLAGQVLSQLSYTPVASFSFSGSWTLKIEQRLTNSEPLILVFVFFSPYCEMDCFCFSERICHARFLSVMILHRKEVIQPHLPIRLPCYDLTPIIEPTFDCCPLAVSSQASGIPDFHGLTGGVYKARERIHRSMLTYDY